MTNIRMFTVDTGNIVLRVTAKGHAFILEGD